MTVMIKIIYKGSIHPSIHPSIQISLNWVFIASNVFSESFFLCVWVSIHTRGFAFPAISVSGCRDWSKTFLLYLLNFSAIYLSRTEFHFEWFTGILAKIYNCSQERTEKQLFF